MKISTERLKQIIKEEIEKLHEFHGEETETPPLDFTNLLMELHQILETWEQKEYPSDEDRYRSYYEDVENLVGKYDPCAHPGQPCEEAHEGQAHEECLEDKQGSEDEDLG